MNPREQKIYRKIEKAFGKVKLGEGLPWRAAHVIHHRGSKDEQKRAWAEDELRDWRRIKDSTIETCYPVFPFSEAQTLAFHLPAFLHYAVRRAGDADAQPAIDHLLAILERRGREFMARTAMAYGDSVADTPLIGR